MWSWRLPKAEGAKLRHYSTPGEGEALAFEGSISASLHSLYPMSDFCLFCYPLLPPTSFQPLSLQGPRLFRNLSHSSLHPADPTQLVPLSQTDTK